MLSFSSLRREVADCSALVTISIKSLISVPEYKPTYFRSEMEEPCSKKTEGDPSFGATLPGGGRLNCQSFEPGTVANYQGRAFQADQPLFL